MLLFLTTNMAAVTPVQTSNFRASFIVFYFVFPTNLRIITLPHTNTVILQNSYCGIGPSVILSECFVADYF